MARDLSQYLNIQIGDSVACFWPDLIIIGIVSRVFERATFPIEIVWMTGANNKPSYYDETEVVEMKCNYVQIRKEIGLG